MLKPYSIGKIENKQDVARVDNLFDILFKNTNPSTIVSSDKVSTFLTLKSPDGTTWYLKISNLGVATWQNTRP